MTKSIIVSGRKYALVDDLDYVELSKYKWFLHKCVTHNTYYAIREVDRPTGKRILMHRQIMNDPDCEIDHKDGNGLNNCRSNLRIASHKQNMYNKKIYKNNKSGYKGVTFDRNRRLWRARIRVNNKEIHLGYFSVIKDAAFAYDEAARNYFGEFARTNFEL